MKNYSHSRDQARTRINESIRVRELRVIGAQGENHGVMDRDEALALAKEAGLDLIEISPNAVPPVAKIMDYGRYKYEQAKKEQRSKQASTETKSVQLKIGTGEHDLVLKTKRVSAWLAEGHRIRLELFLRGRSKYIDKKFLEERFDRALKLITTNYKIAEGPKQGPKGLYMILERAK